MNSERGVTADRTPASNFHAEMRQRYAQGDTPWDTGIPNSELVRVIEAGGLPGKRLLEIGCGTGTNAIELARRGYQVTAIDMVDLAVNRAREKARTAAVHVDLRVGDLTTADLGTPYESLFDLGVYHGIRNRSLPEFLAALRRVSRPGTRWLSLSGNAKEPLPNGPPVVTEEQFRSELGPTFRILEAREFRFDLRPDFQPLAWSILMERR